MRWSFSRSLAGPVALFALLGAQAPAHAERDDLVNQALALEAQQQAAQAYALLQPHMQARAGDPDFDYALGIAAADSGRPAEAILAFQRVLAQQPDHAQARAELARAYAMTGDVDTARAQFNTVVQDPSLPDPVRQRFNSIVRNYDRQISGGGSSVTGFIDASGGYDSNINAATDATSLVIPLFAGLGPGTLAASARATDKGFYDLTAGISGVTALSRQTRLFGSLLSNWRDNIHNTAFDQGSVTGTVGLGHTLANRDVISISGQAQQFWLGHKSYRQAVGGIAQYTHRLSGGQALSVSGEFFFQHHDSDPLRNALRYGLGVSYADRETLVSLSGGHEEATHNAADHLSNSYLRISFGLEKPVTQTVSIVAGANGQLRHYDAADPLFLAKRNDKQVDASIGVNVRVAEHVTLRPRATYTRNWSNIALYDYQRATVSIGARFEF